MTTHERKQREFAARERLFLDRARELIRHDGLLALQMARLAERCDYSTGTLYQHFSSKEDLLVTLTADGALDHARLFEKVAAWRATNRERMFALAVADNIFGERHPDHTRLMQYVFTEVVWENASPQRRQRMMDACRPAAEVVVTIVEDAVARGELPSGDLRPLELALGPWSLCHGMQALVQIRGLLDSLAIRNTDVLLYRQVQVYLNGLHWRPLFEVDDSRALAALVERIRREVIDRTRGANPP